jgi:hypothetical protein
MLYGNGSEKKVFFKPAAVSWKHFAETVLGLRISGAFGTM